MTAPIRTPRSRAAHIAVIFALTVGHLAVTLALVLLNLGFALSGFETDEPPHLIAKTVGVLLKVFTVLPMTISAILPAAGIGGGWVLMGVNSLLWASVGYWLFLRFLQKRRGLNQRL